ncbi:ATP-binding protein [Paraclostridium ghonii]|nr:PAS domain-containing sensor histidine kinase [Paeniclostridium ghonii]MCM0167142.1 ATP-binding protein [Paeniclostridium ghonii]
MNHNLEESKRDLGFVLGESVLNVVFYKDLKGRYIYCNREFCKCLGLKSNQIIGKTDKDIYKYNKQSKIFGEKDKEVIRYKSKRIYQKEIDTVNQKRKYIEITKTPMINSKNQVCGIVGMVRDITNTRHIHEEIEKLKSDFFSNLYHELGTPINAIMSSLQLLSFNIDSMKKVDAEEIQYISDIIKKNGLRLLKLTNNLVYVTKLDSNEIRCNFKKGDIVSFIENICTKTAIFCEGKSISLIFDTNKEEYIGEFDENIIEKILLNLLSNAIKYNKKNGKIEVLLTCEKEYITIKVKDEGVGIPNRYTKRIFEKLGYVDDRLVKLNEGSGLGLYITNSIVNIYGGIIDVNTSLGEGSEFIVKLPFKKGNTKNKISSKCVMSGFDPISIEFSDIY